MKYDLLLVLAVLLVAPVSDALGASCSAGQFRVEVFQGENFSGSLEERCESVIDRDVDSGSMIWTGSFWFDTGYYQFTAESDRRITVDVGGSTIIDASGENSETRRMRRGYHEVIVRYYGGRGDVAFDWKRIR